MHAKDTELEAFNVTPWPLRNMLHASNVTAMALKIDPITSLAILKCYLNSAGILYEDAFG